MEPVSSSSCPRVELSVLLTREEYSAFFVQMKQMERHKTVSFFPILGEILTVLGLLGLVLHQFFPMSVGLAVCLLIVGILLVAFYGMFLTVLDRGTAARDYEEKEDLRTVNQYIFTPDAVTIQNSRIQGTMPLGLATNFRETSTALQLSFGREIHMVVPKRLLSEEQLQLLRDWIRQAHAGHA